MLRLKQICLVAADLDRVEDDLNAIFGIEVAYSDPALDQFGLRNIMLPIGNSFLEVVSPIQENTTAGRFLERRDGDGGYMVILQCGDIGAVRERVERLGIRIVFEDSNEDTVRYSAPPQGPARGTGRYPTEHRRPGPDGTLESGRPRLAARPTHRRHSLARGRRDPVRRPG